MWSITIGDAEQPTPPGGDWTAVIRPASFSKWGSITARRTECGEHLVLRFNDEFAMLEHWSSDDGPVSGARFSNRQVAAEGALELPCCGCGIPLEVPDGFALHKEDAVRLFLQYIASGELPAELVEAQRTERQPALLGMEDSVVPAAVRNAVSWEAL